MHTLVRRAWREVGRYYQGQSAGVRSPRRSGAEGFGPARLLSCRARPSARKCEGTSRGAAERNLYLPTGGKWMNVEQGGQRRSRCLPPNA